MIPDYQTLMLPLLRQLEDGQPRPIGELTNQLAASFGLTEAERRELLPSGRQPVFKNRVGWAKTYLKKAGLIDSPRRATVVISDMGRQVLAEQPTDINVKYLRRFPSFLEFQQGTDVPDITASRDLKPEPPDGRTPEEQMGDAYQIIRDTLAVELLQKIHSQPPAFFEQLVVDLFLRMGYGGFREDAGSVVGRSGDEGIDGIIKEDRLGLDIIYLQAKRWQPGNVVGRPELQKFVGALAGHGAKKGIFITTSSFTRDARAYTPKNETKIVLIDGTDLAQLMIDFNLGCTVQQTFELKKIDTDYFGEE